MSWFKENKEFLKTIIIVGLLGAIINVVVYTNLNCVCGV